MIGQWLRAYDERKRVRAWNDACDTLGIEVTEQGCSGVVEGLITSLERIDEHTMIHIAGRGSADELRFEHRRGKPGGWKPGFMWFDAAVRLHGDPFLWRKILGKQLRDDMIALVTDHRAVMKDGELTFRAKYASNKSAEALVGDVMLGVRCMNSIVEAHSMPNAILVAEAFAGSTQASRVTALRMAHERIPEDPQFQRKWHALTEGTDLPSQFDAALGRGNDGLADLKALAHRGDASAHLIMTTITTLRGVTPRIRFLPQGLLERYDTFFDNFFDKLAASAPATSATNGPAAIAARHATMYAAVDDTPHAKKLAVDTLSDLCRLIATS